jgi:hypothetical protein
LLSKELFMIMLANAGIGKITSWLVGWIFTAIKQFRVRLSA